MTEITITDDHKLPHGYWYEKPVPEEVRHLKSDEEIIEELAGTMPLSEIARICDNVEAPKYERELKARVDYSFNDMYLVIDIYPLSDIFPEMEGEPPLREKRWCQAHIRRVKEYRQRYVKELLNEMIYG